MNTVTPTVTAGAGLSNPARKPRLLWASVYCLLDTSSGAAMAVRQMLRQLVAHGYEVEIVGATVFDHQRGTLRLQSAWAKVQACVGGGIHIQDEPLQHRVVVTASTQREQMTAKEEGTWLHLYQTVLDDFKPDLVFYYGGQVLERLIPVEAKTRAVPVVAYLANANYAGKSWCRDVDVFLTDSQATAAMYAQTQGYQPVAIGAFIDPAAVVAAQHTRERVLFVNPAREKGVGILIQLALLLETRRPDIVFEVVESRGHWQSILSDVSGAMGCPRSTLSNVVVTPNTTDMRPAFGRARLLLAPSLCWENAGRVLAEAMLNGIPAIVSNRGGMPEMIQDGGVTLTLPAKCHEAPYNALPVMTLLEPLVAFIESLYDDERRYKGYAARAYRVGQTVHSLDVSTRRLTDALQPLVGRHCTPVNTPAFGLHARLALSRYAPHSELTPIFAKKGL